MQTSVRGTSSNDPAVSELNWERAFTPGGKFEPCRSAVAHMWHDENGVKSKPIRNHLERYQNFAKDKRHRFNATS